MCFLDGSGFCTMSTSVSTRGLFSFALGVRGLVAFGDRSAGVSLLVADAGLSALPDAAELTAPVIVGSDNFNRFLISSFFP